MLGAGLLLSGQPSYLSLQMTGVSKVCEYMRTPAVSKASLHGPATSQVPRGGAGGQVRDNFSGVRAAAPLLEATPARLVFLGPPGWPWLSAPCPAPAASTKAIPLLTPKGLDSASCLMWHHQQSHDLQLRLRAWGGSEGPPGAICLAPGKHPSILESSERASRDGTVASPRAHLPCPRPPSHPCPQQHLAHSGS